MPMLEEQNPDNFVSGASTSDITDTNSTELIAAQGAGNRVYLKTAVISNGDPTVTTAVQILDGSTVKATVYVGALAAGVLVSSPICITFDPPLRGTANTAWNVKAETNSAQVRAVLSGFRSRR